MVQYAPKHYETQKNMSFWSNGVDRVRLLRQIPTQLRGMNFCINCTSSAHFASSLKQYKMDPNAPKRYEAQQNMSSGSNGVDWVRSLRKLPTRLCGTNFCITCASLAHFAPSLLS